MLKTYRTYTLDQGVKSKALAVIQSNGSIQGENTFKVLLHKTVVVESLDFVGCSPLVVLRTGGFDTVSTRTVINRALAQLPGFKNSVIYRKKGQTFLKHGGTDLFFVDCMCVAGLVQS